MSEPHQHEHKRQAGNTYALPFLLILIFAFIELFGGVFTQSLALLSDAWHMFSDVFALGLAWFAAWLSATRTNYSGVQSRVELLASAINALLMLVVITYIIFEAIDRLKYPKPITGGYVMLIAFAGLVVNVIVAKMLHDGYTHGHAYNHNRRAAYIHVISDLLGSVAAIIAGGVIFFTGWLLIDPLLSIFISLLILYVTLKLIKDIWQAYSQE
jgi:cobalt-zinc-cadmium efflux system protein